MSIPASVDMARHVICPWCMYVHRDSFEFQDECEAECHACDKPISIQRHTIVRYTTTAIEKVA
jgi:hypothetical protein